MSFVMRPLRWFSSASHEDRRTRRILATNVVEVLEERKLLSAAPWAAEPGQAVPVLVAGAAAGAEPRVTVLDAETGEERFSFLAYNAAFQGGVRVALGDINGDGTEDIITAAGPGGGPHVRVFSGLDGAELLGFYAYDPNFGGGVFVAAGDVNGDGRDDIITGAGAGAGPHVRVFSGINTAELRSFYAYDPSFRGGVSVAAGDVNGDGRAEIVTGAGAGAGPHVRVFNGTNNSELHSFYAYHPNFRGGVFVAAGDVNGDGRAEIITGAGAGGGPHVRVLNGQTLADVGGFFAFDSTYSKGAPVAVGNGHVFSGGNPGGAPLARAFSSSGAVLEQFSGLGGDFQQGMFVAAGTMPLQDDPDDAFEDNDLLSQAANLGTLDATQNLDNLHLLDAADWFRFQLDSAGSADAYVRIEFAHASGDVDLGLYNSAGTLVRVSDSVSNSELVSLNGLAAGTYYIKVYGYQGVHNPDYSLVVEPGARDGGGGGPDGANVLYVNFDGATISASDLSRWAAGQWNPNDLPGQVSNGITVSAFFASRSDREQIISGILSRLETDLAPFGITVQRHTGLAVENVGATTLFAGNSTLSHPHVACDIDFGNDNNTDIAFIGQEYWGNVSNTVLAMSDVFLHEAGHTFGLYHVQTVQNGTLYPESMGLRYSADQEDWLVDTSFMDRTFIEFRDANGFWHGPGGGQSQNSYQTLRGNFGLAAPVFNGNLATVNSSHDGTLIVTGSAAADQISIVALAAGGVELSINGQQYTVTGGLEQLVIDTGNDPLDQVQVSGNLSFKLLMDAGDVSHGKLDADQASFWNGTPLGSNGGGVGCCCSLCRGAVDAAFSENTDDLVDLTAASGSLSAPDDTDPAVLESPATDETVIPRQRHSHLVNNLASPAVLDSLTDAATADTTDRPVRSIDEILFALDALDDLFASDLA